MNKNQTERSQKINILMQQLATELVKEKIPVKSDWITWCMDKLYCSGRTAREYVDVAFMRMDLK